MCFWWGSTLKYLDSLLLKCVSVSLTCSHTGDGEILWEAAIDAQQLVNSQFLVSEVFLLRCVDVKSLSVSTIPFTLPCNDISLLVSDWDESFCDFGFELHKTPFKIVVEFLKISIF